MQEVEHPHKLVLSIAQLLGFRAGADSGLMQCAWSLANDALRTRLCVAAPATVVAVAAIALAARRVGVSLPSEAQGAPWWEAFQCSRDQMLGAMRTIQAVYDSPPVAYDLVEEQLRRQEEAANAREHAQHRHHEQQQQQQQAAEEARARAQAIARRAPAPTAPASRPAPAGTGAAAKAAAAAAARVAARLAERQRQRDGAAATHERERERERDVRG